MHKTKIYNKIIKTKKPKIILLAAAYVTTAFNVALLLQESSPRSFILHLITFSFFNPRCHFFNFVHYYFVSSLPWKHYGGVGGGAIVVSADRLIEIPMALTDLRWGRPTPPGSVIDCRGVEHEFRTFKIYSHFLLDIYNMYTFCP